MRTCYCGNSRCAIAHRGSRCRAPRMTEREAVAYWIARSSRAMTGEFRPTTSVVPAGRRAANTSRDPYAVSSRFGTGQMPFVTMKAGGYGSRLSPGQHDERLCASSPSLPRRDDLDLVAVLEPRLGPAALRQHVVIHGDGEMRALIFELVKQRVDAGRGDLARLAPVRRSHASHHLVVDPARARHRRASVKARSGSRGDRARSPRYGCSGRW